MEKSTLVNYLNDVPLKCERNIGHNDFETLFPSICKPEGKHVTYIDTPGFQDNRGFEIEIVNSFFREEILKQVDELKFMILLNHGDVIGRYVIFELFWFNTFLV